MIGKGRFKTDVGRFIKDLRDLKKIHSPFPVLFDQQINALFQLNDLTFLDPSFYQPKPPIVSTRDKIF